MSLYVIALGLALVEEPWPWAALLARVGGVRRATDGHGKADRPVGTVG